MAAEPPSVDPADWHDTWRAARDQGYAWWDVLAAAQEGTDIVVLARALRPSDGAERTGLVRVPAESAVLDSIAGIYAGAAWCEREAAEMLGITFVGLSDNRALLLREQPGQPPLRRDAWLLARTTRDWPGSASRRDNPGGRRQLPVGVPDSRTAEAPSP